MAAPVGRECQGAQVAAAAPALAGQIKRKASRKQVAWRGHISSEWRSFVLTPAPDEKLEVLRRQLVARRSRAVVASVTQLVVAILCVFSYIGRPSRLVLAVSATQIIFAAVGLHGALNLRQTEVAIHLALMGGLTGAYAVTQLAQAFLVHTSPVLGLVLASFSLVILGSMVFNVLLGLAMLSAASAQESAQSSSDDSSSSSSRSQAGGGQLEAAEPGATCIICADGPRDAVFAPCGHRATCEPCGTRLQRQAERCPICRRNITSTVRVYDC